MHKIAIIQRKQFINSTHQACSSYFIKQIQLQRLTQRRILILKEVCPATSYVAAMFHPTIGQCAHQSLSSTATPELGMISTRNKGYQHAHTQPRIQTNSAKPTQLGLSGRKKTIQYTTSFIRLQIVNPTFTLRTIQAN